jgi:HK97 family phage portal protein
MRVRWPWGRLERRDVHPSWAALAAGWGLVPAPAHAFSPEQIAAGCAAVNLISATIASLPLRVYRPVPGGREEAPDHPVAQLFAGRVNDTGASGATLIEALLASALLHGNGLALPSWDGNGLLTSVQFVPWAGCNPQMLRNGVMVFDITTPEMTWGAAGVPRRVLRRDVILLCDRSDNGLLGRPRLSRAAPAIEAALSAQASAIGTYRQGMMPSGLLKLPPQIGPDVAARVQEALRLVSSGVQNFGKLLTVPAETAYEALAITPENAELQDARRLGSADIARLFGIPPSMLGLDQAGTSFNNSREQAKWMATFTLAPWCDRLERELTACLLGEPGWTCEFDMSRLTRADELDRWRAHQIGLTTGALLPDEVREIEGWRPLPNGQGAVPLPTRMPGAGGPGAGGLPGAPGADAPAEAVP